MSRTVAPKSSSTITNKKRKSTGNTEQSAKKPRNTLDTFFSPVVSSSVKKEDAGKHDVALSPEQIAVLRMVVEEGKNVFFTGSAGTGKSLLLRAIINALRKKYSKEPNAISVTASTGMAASNIGGMTIHSWGAVSPTVTKIDAQIPCIKTCKPAFQRWKKTKVLIIDEVSMVDGHLFTMLAGLAKELRKKTEKPFGGMQLVVTGDFFQLPPVTKGKEPPFFAFESEAWKTCIEHTVDLKQVFRQKDNTFVDLLNSMRTGALPPSARSLFESLARPLPPHPSGLLPTSLYPLRAEVERSNAHRLRSLAGPSTIFTAVDTGKAEPIRRQRLLENVMAVERLELRTGAQVMLVKNADAARGLVNGCVGKVLGFYPPSAMGGKSGTSAVITGISLNDEGKPVLISSGKENRKPASASIGSGSSTPVKDETMSVKTETTSSVKGAGKPTSETKPRVKPGDHDLYPLVEFSTPNGSEIVLLLRDEFRVEDADGAVLARRMQVPLVLAWAMSIHKSQGQTIERVKVNLAQVFEKGQSYVALSRATSLEGLQVLGFHPSKVSAHKKVVEWAKTLDPQPNDASTSTPDILPVATESVLKSEIVANHLSELATNLASESGRQHEA